MVRRTHNTHYNVLRAEPATQYQLGNAKIVCRGRPQSDVDPGQAMAKLPNSAQKNMVDGRDAPCRDCPCRALSGKPGYADIVHKQLVSLEEISAMFGKKPGWFRRDRVRKQLYPRDFPRCVIRGRWLRSAVEAWLEREGNRDYAVGAKGRGHGST